MRKLLCKLNIPPNVRGCCGQRQDRILYALVYTNCKTITRISEVYACHLKMLRVEGIWKGDISILSEKLVNEIKRHFDADKSLQGYTLDLPRKVEDE